MLNNILDQRHNENDRFADAVFEMFHEHHHDHVTVWVEETHLCDIVDFAIKQPYLVTVYLYSRGWIRENSMVYIIHPKLPDEPEGLTSSE